MGGFARRMSYWNAFAKKFPNAPALRLDGGSIFATNVAEAPVLNRWMLEGTHASGLAALNLSPSDLLVWQEMFDLAEAGQISRHLLGVPLVSANIAPKVKNYPKIEKFVIRTLPLDSPAGKQVRVGITGLAFDPQDQIDRSIFEVRDPAKAARQVLEEMAPSTDFRILLADVDLGRAISFAVTVPGFNVLLVAHNYASFTEAQEVAGTLIVIPINEGRMISEVRVALEPTSSKLDIQSRFVPLDHRVPDEAAMGQLVRKAQAEVDAFLKK